MTISEYVANGTFSDFDQLYIVFADSFDTSVPLLQNIYTFGDIGYLRRTLIDCVMCGFDVVDFSPFRDGYIVLVTECPNISLNAVSQSFRNSCEALETVS